ncbi:MAG: efflux RND transporter periplasmic adaptor subunit [Fusobacteriaceae bacterium]
MLKKIILSVLLIIISACGNKINEKKLKLENIKNVKTIEIKPKKIVKTNISSGVIEAINQVMEVTKTGGKVVKINYKNGEIVKKGDTVLILENQNIHSEFLKARAGYLFSQSDYNTKKVNYEKIVKLREEKFISEDEFLVKKSGFIQSKSNLDSSRAIYLSAKENYENLNMKSKITGVVTDLDVKMFEEIEVGKVLFTVVDDENLYVKTSVSPYEIVGVQEGNRAILEIEGIEEKQIGKVIEINPVAQKDSKKYQVKVAVKNSEKKIKKGMYSNVTIETGEKITHVVPKNAVVVRDLFSYIYINENGFAKEIKVERGYSNGEEQEVIGTELLDKMDLIIDGQYILENKDKLNIIK